MSKTVHSAMHRCEAVRKMQWIPFATEAPDVP